MPYQKLKSENYRNLGGINSKLSEYQTGVEQFLDIKNMDFQTPGALTKRWGTIAYTTFNFSGPINSVFEYVQTTGFSEIIVGVSGSQIYRGATSGAFGQLNGGNISSTLTVTDWDMVNIRYSSGFFANSIQAVSPWSENLIYFDPAMVIEPQRVVTESSFDSAIFNNFFILSDQFNLFKYNGATTYYFGLPPPGFAHLNAGSLWGASVNTGTSAGLIIPYGATGYYFYAQYVNNASLMGPIWPIASFEPFTQNTASLSSGGGGSTFLAPRIPLHTPLAFGISSIRIYGYADISIGNIANDTKVFGNPFTFIYEMPASGTTFTYVGLGFNVTTFNFTNDLSLDLTKIPYGLTFTNIPGLGSANLYVWENDNPRYIETHLNRLWIAGIATTQNTVFYSEVAQPESISNNIPIETNDGDVIRGMKAYSQKLYVFKTKSFFVISGDNPDNFTLSDVSKEYGCLSNAAIAIYNDLMLFLDGRGIVEFNGSNLYIISNPIQSVFTRMNRAAALGKATMIHDKRRTQILLGIPVDGSTVNNLTVVYDYTIKAWTYYEGFNPSLFVALQGRLSEPSALYGNYSGMLGYFAPSARDDMGVGFTCSFKTRFLHDLGETTQKMFRRMWLNVTPVSQTNAITVDYYKDFGSSIVLTQTVYQNPFQTRTDFGISAKSLAMQISSRNASLGFQVPGFGIAYRYLRDV